MRKYASGNTFSIVAGKRGIITEAEVVGVEYDLTDEDRAFLEPAGFNLIVRRRGFGVMIFSNNTAYQRVKSALNNVHVREALITVERDINRILLNFLFDYNDPTTRLRVKTLVDNYLLAVQDARGIASFEIVFDDSNNGTEVLENNAGIIDIIIDFPRGIQKFINRITITRAGGQLASQSTGFTPSF
jgi:phage tail sheath protein FI